MRRVVIAEFKKIFKSKINIALLVILFAFSAYLNYRTYHSSGLISSSYPEIKEQGEALKSLQLLQKLDKELEEKAGKISNQAYDEYYQQYLSAMQKTYQDDAYDMVRAKEMYGEYAQEVIQKTNDKTIQEEDIERFCRISCEYTQDENESIQFFLPRKNDGDRFYLNLTYFNYYVVDSIEQYDIKESISNPFYVLTHIQEFQYPDGQHAGSLFSMNDDSGDDAKKVATNLSEKMDSNDYTFHSTIANNLFLENLQVSLNVFALLVFAIIIANIFASESNLKTDQIMVATKTGSVKLCVAKIICAVTLGISGILVLWLIAFLSSMICLPIHDLNTVVMNLSGTYSSATNYVFTYSEIILNALLISIATMIVTVFVTLGLSYFTKNRFATIIPVLLLLLLPMFIPFHYLFNIPLLDYVMPGKAMSFINYFIFDSYSSGIPYLMINDIMIPTIYIAVVLFIVLSAIIATAMLMHSKKHIVQNR